MRRLCARLCAACCAPSSPTKKQPKHNPNKPNNDSALELDGRNFHAWSYRQFVVRLLGTPADAELAYAKSVELSNGRAAMLGFWLACAVESATGNGILGQVIVYLKMSGLLGAESGF